MKKQKWPDAQKSLEKAVEIYPKYAAAWYELGMAYGQQKNSAEAQKAFARAIEADPKYLKPYMPSASLAMQEKKWEEVADTTDKLLRLDPVDYPGALMYNAIANINLHNMDAAEKSAREAVKLDTDHQFPRSEYVLGYILASKQDYPDALQLMKSYVERAPNAADVESVKKQIVELEKTAAASGQPKQ
jgi:tetratricopeptide (TPR) repeat protein